MLQVRRKLVLDESPGGYIDADGFRTPVKAGHSKRATVRETYNSSSPRCSPSPPMQLPMTFSRGKALGGL